MAANVGYVALLRRNPAFRRLWYSQVVSQLGDWFDSVALYALLYRLTGSGQAVAVLLVAQFLPAAIIGPWAGVMVDRLPRKQVMIATDMGRGLLVLLLLLVRTPDMIWLVYLVAVLKFTLNAFFEPARGAAIPAVTTREELVAANGIGGATWSAMLAIGAGLGGLVAGTLGTDVAFVLDAATFFWSAVLVLGVPIPEEHLRLHASPGGLHDIAEGARYLLGNRDVLLYTISKGLWSFGGGILLLLTLFGRNIFPLGVDGALSIGLLYTARGLGAGIGPLLAQRFGGNGITFLRRAVGVSFFLTTLGYAAMSVSPSLPLAFLAVMLAHMGGSNQWVFSSTLLQLRVPNRLLGRIFAIELALLTLTTSLSTYLTGVASDAGVSPRTLALALALVFVPTGLFLTVALWRREDNIVRSA